MFYSWSLPCILAAHYLSMHKTILQIHVLNRCQLHEVNAGFSNILYVSAEKNEEIYF
jgi:hypothetical protein